MLSLGIWGTFNPVSWTTDYVSLTAKDFYIEADGVKYLANVHEGSVSSDPGESDYCTLEMIWNEHWQEMRLFIYFTADATHWWADEIRTYDGQSEEGWIYYEGMFFKTALGSAFVGDVDITSSRSEESIQGEEIQGKIHFEGLELQAFRIAERDNLESANAELVTVQAAIEATLEESIAAYNESDFEKCLTYVADLGEEKKAKLMGLLPGLRATTGQVTLVKTENIDIGGPIATADVTGTAQGETLTVTVRFMKQDGIWKVITEGLL